MPACIPVLKNAIFRSMISMVVQWESIYQFIGSEKASEGPTIDLNGAGDVHAYMAVSDSIQAV